MGKDRVTYKQIQESKDKTIKEITDRCLNDITKVLEIGGLPDDLYRECWLSGFRYAGGRIQNTLEINKDRM